MKSASTVSPSSHRESPVPTRHLAGRPRPPKQQNRDAATSGPLLAPSLARARKRQDGSATPVLLLHRARHGRDVVLDEQSIENDKRERADHRARHERAPAIDIAIDEFVHDCDRYGLVLSR